MKKIFIKYQINRLLKKKKLQMFLCFVIFSVYLGLPIKVFAYDNIVPPIISFHETSTIQFDTSWYNQNKYLNAINIFNNQTLYDSYIITNIDTYSEASILYLFNKSSLTRDITFNIFPNDGYWDEMKVNSYFEMFVVDRATFPMKKYFVYNDGTISEKFYNTPDSSAIGGDNFDVAQNKWFGGFYLSSNTKTRFRLSIYSKSYFNSNKFYEKLVNRNTTGTIYKSNETTDLTVDIYLNFATNLSIAFDNNASIQEWYDGNYGGKQRSYFASLIFDDLTYNFTDKIFDDNGNLFIPQIFETEPIIGNNGDWNYIDYPLNYFYDSDTSKWKMFYRLFKSTNFLRTYSLKLELIDWENSDKSNLPFSFFLNNSILDAKDYWNRIVDSEYTSANGYGGGFSAGSGSGGGSHGGGGFGDGSDCFVSPYETSSSFSSSKLYGSIVFDFDFCFNITSKVPSDFKTRYIRLYYKDVEFFSSADEVLDDYVDSVFEPINGTIGTIVQPFIGIINSRFSIIPQIFTIFDSFNYLDEVHEPPIFEIDTSALGNNKLPQKLKIIDFTFYDQYRDTVFFWIKLSLGTLVLLKTYQAVIKFLDRGGR